jgi:hypothetical protein
VEQENGDSCEPHSPTLRPSKRSKLLHNPPAGLTFPDGLFFDLDICFDFDFGVLVFTQYHSISDADNIWQDFGTTPNEQFPVWISDQSLGGTSLRKGMNDL